jgi:hypothetical protein
MKDTSIKVYIAADVYDRAEAKGVNMKPYVRLGTFIPEATPAIRVEQPRAPRTRAGNRGNRQ